MKRGTIISVSVCAVLIAGLTFGLPNVNIEKSDLVSGGQRAIVLVGPSSLVGVENNGRSILSNERSDLRVQKERKPRVNRFDMATVDFDEYIKITNVGRSTITIQNVLINGKEHCVRLGTTSNLEPPVTLLDMGGWANLRFVCSGAIVEAKVGTDHGNATYSWK